MASLLSICFLFLSLSLLFLSFSPASSQNPEPKTPSSTSASSIIQQVCKTTRFPDPCETSLAQSNHVPSNPSPIQVIQTAIWVSSNNLKRVQSLVKSILYASAENKNRTNVAKICIEVLNYSQYRISQADDALPQGKVKDARAWMSAALAYQYDCWSGLKNVNDTELVADTISYMDAVIGFSSNAMSMLMSYDEFGDEIDKWAPPKTERDGFWQSTEGGDSQLWSSGGVPLKLTPNVTVCKDGRNGCYKKVQEAVNAAPNNTVGGKKFVIGIKEGVYEETVRIPLEKKNVVFLGDGMGKTVITGSAHVGIPGMSTYESATVGVVGDGFMASGLTIQNKAGPDVRQAVAFRSDSDQSVLENCEFLGHQDTLYVHSLRQFYKTCRIQGSIDFIFGNAASFFEDCDILVRPRQVNPEKGEDNVITAHGRTDPAQTTGFVFHNCMINGTTDYLKLYRSNPQVHHNFLGRPWKDFSRTVFINCTIEDIVTPQGWLPWSGEFALKTLYYGEFNNSGSGSNTTQRVSWSNQIPTEQVKTYSIHNFIQGNDWIPTSGSEPTNS